MRQCKLLQGRLFISLASGKPEAIFFDFMQSVVGKRIQFIMLFQIWLTPILQHRNILECIFFTVED